MVQFPLTIEIYRNQDGMWRARACSLDFDVTCLSDTKEHCLGAVFFTLKDIPGFHLWTFNIVAQEEEEVQIVPPIPTPSTYEMAVLQEVGKIAAIKAYKARTGLGLCECKAAIEKEAKMLGLEPKL